MDKKRYYYFCRTKALPRWVLVYKGEEEDRKPFRVNVIVWYEPIDALTDNSVPDRVVQNFYAMRGLQIPLNL